MSRKFIFFDFDGVIADSFAAAFETNREIDGGLSETEYRSLFSGNINTAFKERHRKTGHVPKNDFFSAYGPRLLASSLFADMAGVIGSLSAKYTLSIVSSTRSDLIEQFLGKHDLRNNFSEIFGNDVHHSKHEKVNTLLSLHDLSPKNAVFVSDTVGDAREARLAGVDTIGVSWGYQTKDILPAEEFFAIVDTPAELRDKIEEYFLTQ